MHTEYPAGADDFLTILAARRNYTLRRLVAPGPDDAALSRIVEAGAQAPDHGLLRPWRFILIPQHKRHLLGDVFAAAVLARDPACGDEALATAHDKALRAPCLLVAVLRDEPGTIIPAHEKLVSLGCAIQNMLVVSQLLGFAGGLASGAAMDFAGMRTLLGLDAHERAICFIGIGTASTVKAPRARPDVGQFLSIL